MDQLLAVAQKVLKRLEEAGFQAYLVGGSVRDRLLGKPPKDIDIATEAHPDQVESLFAHTVPTGRKHGTVTVLIDHLPIEVTTFRREVGYQDFRRPSEVEFVSSLEEDLSRRDFTINAMAMDREGRIYDPFGGAADLKQGLIRAVGDAKQRLQEDALRMLRAVRFAAQLQFQLEEETAAAIRQQKEYCRYLAVERVVGEWEKIWASPQPAQGIQLVSAYEMWGVLPPFCAWQWQAERFESRSFLFVPGLPHRVYWAFLLWLAQTSLPEVVARARQLRLRRRDGQAIKRMFSVAAQLQEVKSPPQWKRLLLSYGLPAVEEGLYLEAFAVGRSPDREQLKQVRAAWQSMPVRSIADLSIDGRDLQMHVQRPGGPWIRETLNYLLEQVAIYHLLNQRETLIKEGIRFVTGNASTSAAVAGRSSGAVSVRSRDRQEDRSQPDDDLERN